MPLHGQELRRGLLRDAGMKGSLGDPRPLPDPEDTICPLCPSVSSTLPHAPPCELEICDECGWVIRPCSAACPWRPGGGSAQLASYQAASQGLHEDDVGGEDDDSGDESSLDGIELRRSLAALPSSYVAEQVDIPDVD